MVIFEWIHKNTAEKNIGSWKKLTNEMDNSAINNFNIPRLPPAPLSHSYSLFSIQNNQSTIWA